MFCFAVCVMQPIAGTRVVNFGASLNDGIIEIFCIRKKVVQITLKVIQKVDNILLLLKIF